MRRMLPFLLLRFAHSSYLITLDHDFFAESVMALSRKEGLAIMKPKEFIEQHRG